MHWKTAAAALAVALLAWIATDAAERDPTFSSCADGVVAARIIAVNGRHFPLLRKIAPETLRLWATRDGARVAVPFQIDECAADGSLVVPAIGAPAPASPFGARSVLLFRAADAFAQARGGDARVAYEIEVEGKDGPRFVYLGVDPALAVAAKDEVDYEPADDVIRADRYTTGFASPQTDYFSLADGKGHERGNLIDRLKARVEAKFLFGLVRFVRDESQVSETVLGAIDGPIRVVRRSRLAIEIGWGIPAPEILSDDYFYADHAEGPVHINLPFSLAYVFGDLDVEIFLDFRDLEDFEVRTRHSPEPLARVGEGTKLAGTVLTDCFALRRGDVGFLHRLRFGPTLRPLVTELVYRDDPTLEDPPEDVPGARPAIGYRMTGWNAVGRGRHEIWLDMYVVDGTAAADPQGTIERFKAQPEVGVRLVEAD